MNGARELAVEVLGMTCDHCEHTVAKALQSVPGVKQVLEVSHARALARVAASPETSAAQIEGAVAKAGYRARVQPVQQPPGTPGVISGDGEFDLVVVGGGSAGFTISIRTASS